MKCRLHQLGVQLELVGLLALALPAKNQLRRTSSITLMPRLRALIMVSNPCLRYGVQSYEGSDAARARHWLF